MKKVLLSGFEPFGGESINPSLELIRQLQNERFQEIEVHLIQLPVVFGESIAKLRAAITEIDPDIVIGIGQAGGRTALSLERVALNVDDAVIADNAGNQPVDLAIDPAGPAAYFSTLPIKKMMQAARAAGAPALVSNTAGTYVCNHLMYGIMHTLAGTEKLGGFIHIPYLPAQVVDKPAQPAMALETMLSGIRAMIEAAVEEREDAKITAGTLD